MEEKCFHEWLYPPFEKLKKGFAFRTCCICGEHQELNMTWTVKLKGRGNRTRKATEIFS